MPATKKPSCRSATPPSFTLHRHGTMRIRAISMAPDRTPIPAPGSAPYDTLHPETKHGTPGVNCQVGDIHKRAGTDRFTADSASKAGESERIKMVSTAAYAVVSVATVDRRAGSCTANRAEDGSEGFRTSGRYDVA